MLYDEYIPDACNPIDTVLADQHTTFAALTAPQNNKTPCTIDYAGTEEALEFLEAVYTGRIQRIAIKVDPDVDGYTSAAMFVSLFEAMKYVLRQEGQDERADKLSVELVFAHGKEHGFNENEFNEQLGADWKERVQLVIIPDAGSDFNSIQTAKDLDEYNIYTLIVDHHPIEEPYMVGYKTVHINPYLIDNEDYNTCFTGAGITYRTLCTRETLTADDQTEPLEIPGIIKAFMVDGLDRYLLELCALGQVADVSDLRNEEVRSYVLEGIRNICADMKNESEHNFIVELYRANRYNIKHGPTITSLGWYIAPPMNATIRYGTDEEKRAMFQALVKVPYDERTVMYTPSKRADPTRTPIPVALQKDMARRCRNIKSRQDKAVRELTKQYLESIPEDSLQNDSVIAITADSVKDKDKALTGLIANKLTLQVHRPVLLLSATEKTYSGSGRGYGASNINNFKGTLKDAMENIDVVPTTLGGHPNAFGFAIAKSELRPTIEEVNKAYPFDQGNLRTPVSYEIKAKDLTNSLVKSIGKHYALWGNHVNEPVFAITDVKAKTNDIESYKNGQTIVVKSNGIKYVKKYCGGGEYDRLIEKACKYGLGGCKTFTFTMIGTFELENDDAYVKVSNWEGDVIDDGEADLW